MSESNLPRRVEWRVSFFVPYFRRWMSKSFHGIRLSKAGRRGARPARDVAGAELPVGDGVGL